MKKLQVKGRYLAWNTGEPFFYLADTAWELFHKLDREETKYYLTERTRQGFNVVQAVALAEYEGLTVPNAYGRLPLRFCNGSPEPSSPDTEGEYSYWDHVDYAIHTAAEKEIFIALLPTWGDKYNLLWGKGPVVFTEDNAYIYGKWIANRYKDDWNIIWMLGGDRPLEPAHRKIIDAMAKGIREVDSNHLITFHPPGVYSSTDFVGDANYIDFHTAQTSHGMAMCMETDKMMLRMSNETTKPFMDSEPRYEDYPACVNDKWHYYWNEDDIRQNAYWNVLTGACGHTYGNHCIWYMNREPNTEQAHHWKAALLHTGAEQVHHVKTLRLSRDFFSLQYAPELLPENFPGMGHMIAAKGIDYAYVYSPMGVPFKVALDVFGDRYALRGLWFNPRTGEENLFAVFPGRGSTLVVPPSQGKGCDWVLILEVQG